MEWSKKVEEHQKEVYTDKEIAALQYESIKYELLGELKKEIVVPGPFYKDKQVKEFMNMKKSEKENIDRLCKEVRYARISSASLKPTSAVFRLQRS